MTPFLQASLASVISVMASSGFWAWIQSKDSTKDATAKLLMGLAYDKVTTIGLKYIERGWITRDEFEEYERYFFAPYQALGGNGVAKKIRDEVARLPFRKHSQYDRIYRNRKSERSIPDVAVYSQRIDEAAS